MLFTKLLVPLYWATIASAQCTVGSSICDTVCTYADKILTSNKLVQTSIFFNSIYTCDISTTSDGMSTQGSTASVLSACLYCLTNGLASSNSHTTTSNWLNKCASSVNLVSPSDPQCVCDIGSISADTCESMCSSAAEYGETLTGVVVCDTLSSQLLRNVIGCLTCSSISKSMSSCSGLLGCLLGGVSSLLGGILDSVGGLFSAVLNLVTGLLADCNIQDMNLCEIDASYDQEVSSSEAAIPTDAISSLEMAEIYDSSSNAEAAAYESSLDVADELADSSMVSANADEFSSLEVYSEYASSSEEYADLDKSSEDAYDDLAASSSEQYSQYASSLEVLAYAESSSLAEYSVYESTSEAEAEAAASSSSAQGSGCEDSCDSVLSTLGSSSGGSMSCDEYKSNLLGDLKSCFSCGAQSAVGALASKLDEVVALMLQC